jgi:hypothetical protein
VYDAETRSEIQTKQDRAAVRSLFDKATPKDKTTSKKTSTTGSSSFPGKGRSAPDTTRVEVEIAERVLSDVGQVRELRLQLSGFRLSCHSK